MRSYRLYSLLKNELISLDRYLSGQLKVIGYKEFTHSDTTVSNVMSYADWGTTFKLYPIVKVEGLESNKQIVKSVKQHRVKNIHLFVSQQSGKSFDWHTDKINVYLYVFKGRKIVQLKNRVVTLYPGHGIVIPKGHLHRVFSKRNTWALSIGY